MVILVILLLAAAALALILVLRRGRTRGAFLFAAGWLGSWMVLGSLLALPFLRLGTQAQMRANAEWLVQQANLVKVVYQLPNAQEWLPPLPELKAESILERLEAPNKQLLLDYVNSQRLINGLRLMRLVQSVQPMLTLYLAVAVLVGFLGIIVFGARLLNPTIFPPIMAKALGAASLALLFVMLGYTASLDTLGQFNNLPLRLLLVFAQAQQGPGFWTLSLGLVLCVLGAMPDWFGLSTALADESEEPYT